MKEGIEEGDICGVEDCIGILKMPKVVGCSCHINPPCSACVNNKPTCDLCGREVEDE